MYMLSFVSIKGIRRFDANAIEFYRYKLATTCLCPNGTYVSPIWISHTISNPNNKHSHPELCYEIPEEDPEKV